MSTDGGRLLLVGGATAAGAAVTIALVIAFTWIILAATGLGIGDAPTPVYLTLNLSASFLAAVLGGGVAATLAGEILPAWLLGALLLLLSAGSLTSPAPGQPAWYPAAGALLGAAGAVLGGIAVERRHRQAMSGGRLRQAP